MLSEQDVAQQIKKAVEPLLPAGYKISIGKNLIYRIEVNALAEVIPNSINSPKRGSYAFQTDLLVEKVKPEIPLVAIELKCGSFSSHDVITYSSKAAKHKGIYPYLRYGFLIVGAKLGRRFVTHNEGFDFAISISDVEEERKTLIGVIERQIDSAERLAGMMQTERLSMDLYEEVVRSAR